MKIKNVKLLQSFKELNTDEAALLLRTIDARKVREFARFLQFSNNEFESLFEAVRVYEATLEYAGQRVELPFSYRQFFDAMMDLWNIDNIRDLTPEQRDDFFTFIELAWRSENPETDDRDRGGDDRDLPENPPFSLEDLANKVLELWGVTKEEFKNLPEEKKKDIITTIKTFWVFDDSANDDNVASLLEESKEQEGSQQNGIDLKEIKDIVAKLNSILGEKEEKDE